MSSLVVSLLLCAVLPHVLLSFIGLPGDIGLSVIFGLCAPPPAVP
jgi:hypothetical protein